MLFVSLLFFLVCINLYKPFTQRFPLPAISMAGGVLIGELALQAGLIFALIWLWNVATGQVYGMAGMLATMLNLASYLLLINYFVESLQSVRPLRYAVDTLLTESAAPQDPPVTEPQAGEHPLALLGQLDSTAWRRCWRPFSIRLPEVQVIPDLIYCERQSAGAQLRLKLDVYRPKAETNDAPVMLYIHGGGLFEKGGTKRGQGLPQLNEFASRGWVCVSIDYRLSPAYRWPDHLEDCVEALAWIKQNIHDYGGNGERVVVSGDSAGGQLAALTALYRHDAEQVEAYSRVSAAICFYGVMDFGDLHGCQSNKAILDEWIGSVMPAGHSDEELRSANPIACVHAEAPPFLIIHGDRDSLISVKESQLFSEKLHAVSNEPVIYCELTGAQHAFNMCRNPRTELVLPELVRFANWANA